MNRNASCGELGEYYMLSTAKADYPADCDADGFPMLNYHGQIALQYNQIAIAQISRTNILAVPPDGRAVSGGWKNDPS